MQSVQRWTSVFAAAALSAVVASGALAQDQKSRADQPAETRNKAEERGADTDAIRQHPGGLVQFVTVDPGALKHATEADRDRTERGAAASPKTGEKK